MNDNITPHIHAEVIKAWADGHKIEKKILSGTVWIWVSDYNPKWEINSEYRIYDTLSMGDAYVKPDITNGGQDSIYALDEKVNHPLHYGGGENIYETINVIEAWGLDFCLGNAVKYISRAGKKDNIKQDLEKAIWYLQRKINKLK